MKTIICEIIFHSLWLGTLLAVASGLVMLLTRDTTATRRYQLLNWCLLGFAGAMAVAVGYTFAHTGGTYESVSVSTGSRIFGFNATDTAGVVQQWMVKYAVVIVWVWLLTTLLKTGSVLLGLGTLHRFKRVQTFASGRYWQQYVNDLSASYEIDKPVHLLQSSLAKAPMVIGHRRPAILVPAGLLTQLPTAEVEAILRHELAHIRRNDYSVNLLQAVLEILFFYHPAVLWTNHLIRIEREHCCDDMALNSHLRKHDYVNALLSCQAYHVYPVQYALAFAGSRKQLLARINRIMAPKTPINIGPGRALLVLAALAVMGFAAQYVRADGRNTRTTVRKSVAQNESGITLSREVVEDNSNNANPLLQPGQSPFTQQEGEALRQELLHDQLITDPNALSYELNDHELVVNNVRQPEAIHRRYADKYVRYAGRNISYSYNHNCR